MSLGTANGHRLTQITTDNFSSPGLKSRAEQMMLSLCKSNIVGALFEVPIWHLKNYRPYFTNNSFKVANCDLQFESRFEPLLTMLCFSKQLLILFTFDNPSHIAAAFRASAAQHQHAGLDLARQVAHGRSLSAMNTPDVV
jgi:hypothetical protein